MKFVVQRVSKSSVEVDGKVVGKINRGLMVLIGISDIDTEDTADYLINKLIKLRIFEDDKNKMNLSLKDINGELLLVSQFTLYADCTHGNRPSFTKCLEPSRAKELYDFFNNYIKEMGYNVKTGVFGADMKVNLINDGPFTMVIDSEELL